MTLHVRRRSSWEPVRGGFGFSWRGGLERRRAAPGQKPGDGHGTRGELRHASAVGGGAGLPDGHTDRVPDHPRWSVPPPKCPARGPSASRRVDRHADGDPAGHGQGGQHHQRRHLHAADRARARRDRRYRDGGGSTPARGGQRHQRHQPGQCPGPAHKHGDDAAGASAGDDRHAGVGADRWERRRSGFAATSAPQ